MKIIFIACFIFFPYFLYAQTEEELRHRDTLILIARYLDTLKMGGSYLIGKAMPDFNFVSTSKCQYSTSSLNNKITFINLWFEACPPCIAEMEALNRLYDRYRRNKKFQFLSITYERKEDLKGIVKKYKIKYPIISTTIDSCYLLNFKKGFPTSIITDEQGKITYFAIGGNLDPKEAKDSIEAKIYPILRQMLN